MHKSRRDKADDLLWPPDDLFFLLLLKEKDDPFTVVDLFYIIKLRNETKKRESFDPDEGVCVSRRVNEAKESSNVPQRRMFRYY